MQRFAASGSSPAVMAVDAAAVASGSGSGRLARGPPPAEMGILLMIRTVTRAQRDSSSSHPGRAKVKSENMDADDGHDEGALAARNEEEVWVRNDLLRTTILDYVLEDLPARYVIVMIW